MLDDIMKKGPVPMPQMQNPEPGTPGAPVPMPQIQSPEPGSGPGAPVPMPQMQTPGPSNIPVPGGDNQNQAHAEEIVNVVGQMAQSMGVPPEAVDQFLDSPQFGEAMQYWDGGGDMGLEMLQYKLAEFAGAGANDLDSIMGNAGMRGPVAHKGDKGGYDMDGQPNMRPPGDMMPAQYPGSEAAKGRPARVGPDVFEDGSSVPMQRNAPGKNQGRLR